MGVRRGERFDDKKVTIATTPTLYGLGNDTKIGVRATMVDARSQSHGAGGSIVTIANNGRFVGVGGRYQDWCPSYDG